MSDTKMSKIRSEGHIKTYNYKAQDINKFYFRYKDSMEKTYHKKYIDHQKTQTKIVQHAHGFSTFNQKLILVFDISFDTEKAEFQTKITQIVAVTIIDEEAKSAGYAKIDISGALNRNMKQQTITASLSGCIDPEGYVELTLYYEQINQVQTDQMSMWNASSRDFNMSKLDISDLKSDEIKDFNLTIDKMKQLTKRIKQSKQNEGKSGALYQQKMDMIQGQNGQLRSTIKNLQTKIQQNQRKWKQQKLSLQKQITSLQKTVQKKSKQLSQKAKQLSLINQQKSNDYENNMSQLRRDSFEDGNQKNPFQSSGFGIRNSMIVEQKIQTLQKQRADLQNKLTDMSMNIGKLFNAALEIGGPQLLDRLQQSMGLGQ